MKHFLLIFITLFLASCSVTTKITTYYGDIIWYDNNGKVIENWESVVFKEEKVNVSCNIVETTTNKTNTDLVNSGVKFTDNKGYEHYISGGLIHISNIFGIVTITSNKKSNTEIDDTNDIGG